MNHKSEIGEVTLFNKAVRIEFVNSDKSLAFINSYSPALDSIKEAFDTGASSASAMLVYVNTGKAKTAFSNIIDRIDSYLA